MSAHTIALPEHPLYLAGYAPPRHKPRFANLAVAPKIPLYQLGYMGAGSAAGPIGTAVSIVTGLIAGLMAKHELRKKQATNENSAVNVGVSGFDTDIKQIQQAYNSGQIDASGAAQAVQVVIGNYWSLVTPQIQPSRNQCQGGAACPSGSACGGNYGAACCVGCSDIDPSVSGPSGILAAIQGVSTSSRGKNTADIIKVFPSKYGATQRNAYSLTFQQPAGTSAESVASAISSLTSGGSSSSLLLIGAAVVAAMVLL